MILPDIRYEHPFQIITALFCNKPHLQKALNN